jgi:hypothetical protein
MTRLVVAIWAAMLAICPTCLASDWVLTPSSQRHFEQVSQILGGANIAIYPASAVLTKGPHKVELSRLNTRPWFVVLTTPKNPQVEGQVLQALETVFVDNPWLATQESQQKNGPSTQAKPVGRLVPRWWAVSVTASLVLFVLISLVRFLRA